MQGPYTKKPCPDSTSAWAIYDGDDRLIAVVSLEVAADMLMTALVYGRLPQHPFLEDVPYKLTDDEGFPDSPR